MENTEEKDGVAGRVSRLGEGREEKRRINQVDVALALVDTIVRGLNLPISSFSGGYYQVNVIFCLVRSLKTSSRACLFLFLLSSSSTSTCSDSSFST